VRRAAPKALTAAPNNSRPELSATAAAKLMVNNISPCAKSAKGVNRSSKSDAYGTSLPGDIFRYKLNITWT
jgi:hypothetical protein